MTSHTGSYSTLKFGTGFHVLPTPVILILLEVKVIVHKNPGDNPEVRYIEFLLMDSGSELSPEQDPVVWKILNFGHFALNNAN